MGSWTPASLRRKRGSRCVGITKVGKGTKRSILVDRNGTPISFVLERANVHELKLADRVLAGVAIRGRGPHGYRLRYIVERTNAWLGFERRIQVRHDRLIEAYEGFFTLVCIKIALRQFRNHRR